MQEDALKCVHLLVFIHIKGGEVKIEDIIVGDLETVRGCFLASYYIPFEDKWYDFIINKDIDRNDLPSLLYFLDKYKDNKFFIYFNGINFDQQIIEYVIKHYDTLIHLDNKSLTVALWQFAQDVIETTSHGGYLSFREEYFTHKIIDPFKIQHFDNRARLRGLKVLEFEMDAENIEEMSIPHDKEDFTQGEIDQLIHYCHNDVIELYHNYKYLIGDCNNSLYKGTNQIELREELTKTFGINCLNYSDSKFGDELMKKIYAETENISIKDLPKKGTFRKELDFSKCIPSYIKFKTKNLQDFLKELKKTKIKTREDYEKLLKIGNRKHTFAKGGLHSSTENEYYESDDEYELIDADVSGFYPKSIINHKVAPKHLNASSFVKAVDWLYTERLKLKGLVKTHPEYKALVAGYKIAAVSIYGKMGDMTNWMYDPQSLLHICVAGELSLLMLIEECELLGIECIASNTDGIMIKVHKSKKEEFLKICDEWCKLTNYELEFVNFKKVFFQNLNSYIGLTESNNVKKKGTFMTDMELHKNKSFRVIPLALEQYFINGIKPEEYIMNFNNMFDFCGRSSGTRTYYHKDVTNNVLLPKLIRYYPCNTGGYKIMKKVYAHNTTNANDTNIQPAEYNKIVCNYLPKEDYQKHLDNVNRTYFIEECYNIIRPIELGRKLKINKVPKEQLKLF